MNLNEKFIIYWSISMSATKVYSRSAFFNKTVVTQLIIFRPDLVLCKDSFAFKTFY